MWKTKDTSARRQRARSTDAGENTRARRVESRRNLYTHARKHTIRTLEEAAERGNHCQSTVLDFLNLELSQILRRRGDVEEIERTTRVDRVEAVERGFVKLPLERDETRRTSAFGAELFNTSHQSDLNSGEERDKLQEFRTAGFAIQKHLTRLRPHATRQTQGFGDDETRNSEHGPTRVNDFSDAVLVNLTISTEAERVETIVTGEGTVEVARDIRRRQETAREVELTVRAYARLGKKTMRRTQTRVSHTHTHTHAHASTRTPLIANRSIAPTSDRARAIVRAIDRVRDRAIPRVHRPGAPHARPDLPRRTHAPRRHHARANPPRIPSTPPSRTNRVRTRTHRVARSVSYPEIRRIRANQSFAHPIAIASRSRTQTHAPYHLESPFADALDGAALRVVVVALRTTGVGFFTTVVVGFAAVFFTVVAGAGFAAGAFLAPKRDVFAGADLVFAGAGAAFLNRALTCIVVVVVGCAGMAIARARVRRATWRSRTRAQGVRARVVWRGWFGRCA